FHDFETGLPAAWQAPQTSDGGKWQINEGQVGYYPNPGQGAWVYVNDEAFNDIGSAVLETVAYDLGGYDGEISLAYDFLFQEYAGSSLVNLEIFDGRSWALVLQDTLDFSGRIELDLSSFAGSTVKFRWTFDDEGAWAWGMGPDNFLLRAQRSSCGNGRCEGGESPESCPEDCPMRVQPAPGWVEFGKDLAGREVSYRYFKGRTRCDDCSEQIDLPFEFDFYGSLHPSLYLNANGNFTFEEPYKEYTPQPFCLDGPLMLAPFFADLDLNAGGAIYYYLDPEGHYLLVQWSEVGYFGCEEDCGLKNSFQAVLTDGSIRKVGALEVPKGINVVFSYGDMQWTTGSSSGGVNGLGGSAATVGLNSGNGVICASLGAFNRPGFEYYGSTVDFQCPLSAVSYLDHRSFLVDASDAWAVESQTLASLAIDLVV
ncbi:MAG: nidogen-like domain-containing protein, partial [Bacteroidota bacterium]